MKQDHFGKKLWISGAVIAISILLAFFGLSFFASDLTAQANAIVAARAEIQAENDSVANLAKLKEQAPKAERYQAIINQRLPDQYGLVNFGEWFIQKAKQYGVTANASLQGSINSPQGTTPGSVPFTFYADGSLVSITQFLNAVVSSSSGFVATFNTFDMTVDGTNQKISGQGTLFFR